MGRLFFVCRLVARDLRHHLAQAVLLLVAIVAATTVLTLALALNGVTSHPYRQTQAATKGPDDVAYMSTPAQAAGLLHAPGVIAHSGPYPIASGTLRVHGLTAGVEAQGRTEAPAAVDQPDVLSGGWVRPGGVVIERTFAQALRVGLGSRVTVDDHPFTVVGLAVTAAQPPYPNLCYLTANSCVYLNFTGQGPRSIGLIWMTEADATELASPKNPLQDYVLNLMLSHPAAAPALADRYENLSGSPQGPPGGPPTGLVLAPWEGIAQADALLVADEQSVLAPGAVLLGLLALASVAVLVGARLAERTRRVGLLKAVGSTPGLITFTFLAENLFVALVASAIGLAAGWWAAPLITNPGSNLVGTAGAPSLTALSAVEVVGVAFIVVLGAALIPALRAARTSTVSALADRARTPKRRGPLIGLSRRLPVPMLLGLRLVARRPRRALLSAASIAVTVTGVVAAVAFHSAVGQSLSSGVFAAGLGNPVLSRDEQGLAVITVMLVTLSVLTAVFAAWATILDARRATAVTRALGASAGQVSGGLVTAQVLAAVPGALLGVPLGIGLFAAAAKSEPLPSPLWLAATVLGTVLMVAGLTIVPARMAARRPVAPALHTDSA